MHLQNKNKKMKHCKIKENVCSKMTSLKAKSTNDFFFGSEIFPFFGKYLKEEHLVKTFWGKITKIKLK